MSKKKLLIFGAGGHAVKMSKIALSLNFDVVGYISTEPPGTIVDGLPVLGNIEYFIEQNQFKGSNLHIAIGENSVRGKIFNAIKNFQDNLVSILSDKSIVSYDAVIGAGTCVSQGAIIQNNSNIGKCCIIDTGSIIDHDTHIGDFVNISPRAVICSHVKIGKGAFIGAGTTVIDKITIGENTLIGAGSVVVRDIEPNVVAFGNPARVYRKRDFNENIFKPAIKNKS